MATIHSKYEETKSPKKINAVPAICSNKVAHNLVSFHECLDKVDS